MEAKSGLNNTQRKILEGIYVDRLKEKKDIAVRAKRDGRPEFVKQVTTKIRKTPEVKNVEKAFQNLVRELIKNEDKLKEYGVSISDAYRNDKYSEYFAKYKLYVRDSYDGRHKDLEAFDKEVDAIADKYDKAIQEVRVKIWGMNVSYTDLETEIDAVLAAL